MSDAHLSHQIALPLNHHAEWIGTAAAPGVAIGEGVLLLPHAVLDAVPTQQAEDIPSEITLFKAAVEVVSRDIARMEKSLSALLNGDDANLFHGYHQILTSDTFFDTILGKIEQGVWIQTAIRDVTKDLIARFAALEDPYLKERARDIADLGKRVLSQVQKHNQQQKSFPAQSIVIGPEITASMLAEMPHSNLKGIVSINSTLNSHMVILARALNVPVIIHIEDELDLNDLHGKTLIVDGYAGQVIVSPDEMLTENYQQLIQEEKELSKHLLALKNKICVTKDHYAMPLRANIGMLEDLKSAESVNAQGIGLYRTEVPFMAMESFPSEESQTALYQQLLKAFPQQPVIMRVLDIGGDKQLAYFPIREDNPFLGWRGIRLLLDEPDIFKTQIRAMLKASVGLCNLHILLPMVSVVSEVIEAKKLIYHVFDQLTQEGLTLNFPKIGAMIEVPAAVYCAEEITAVSDFICVGSNDLTQYLMATDRTNNRVAKLYNPFHPAMLKALLHIVTVAKQLDTPVSLCGEMANNPVALVMLIGIGFDSLSLNSHDLLKIKWLLRGLTQSRCRDLLMEAMQFKTGKQVYHHFKQAIIHAGFGGLIRAGKK